MKYKYIHTILIADTNNRLSSKAQKYSKDQKLVLGNTGDCTAIKKNETHFEFSEIACNTESYFICEVGKSISIWINHYTKQNANI